MYASIQTEHMARLLSPQIRIPQAIERQQLMMDWFPNTDPIVP